MNKLSREFFSQSTLVVAPLLLGKTIVFKNFQGIITETEAYIGQDDPASHAARGMTPRSQVMFGPAGFSYVYFIYGMYHCLNFVTESDGSPGAVLIRGLKLLLPHVIDISGPGRICKNLGLNLTHNKIDITTASTFCVLDTPSIETYQSTPRIGITKGREKLWRFIVN